jgi:hypothetical protein
MPVNISKLEAFEAKLKSLASGDMSEQLREKAVEIAVQKVQDTVSSGRTPYGDKWPSPAPGLSRLRVSSNSSGVSIKHRWAAIHQNGAKIEGNMMFRGLNGWKRPKQVIIPRRELIPKRGTPKKWLPLLKKAAIEAIRMRLKL